MGTFIVVVTGGRSFTDYGYFSEVLDAAHALTPFTEVRHGAAPGADALASKWAHEHKVDVNAFGAKWGQWGAAAGPRRNRLMLDTSPRPNLVIAFPVGKSIGTWSCINEAKKVGIPVSVARRPLLGASR